MNDQTRGLAVGLSMVVLLAMAGCGSESAVDRAWLAGGGDDRNGATVESLRLDGYPADLAVEDGVVHLLAFTSSDDRRLVTVDPDGTVSTTSLPGDSARYVAAGPGGTVYVASDDTIYRVDAGAAVPVVVTEQSDEKDPDAVVTEGSVDGLAVDGDGSVIWTESFVGSGPDGSEPTLVRVMRLTDAEIEHVAGAETIDVAGDELTELQVSPPEDRAAVDLPLRYTGGGGGVAADEDGSIYLAGNDSILRIAPDGTVNVVIGPGERDRPERPLGDEAVATEFGGAWASASISASDGVVAATDVSLEGEDVDVEPFAWSSDDFADGAQAVAEKIIRRPSGVDGEFDLDAETTQYGAVAVVIRDGKAATVMAQVSDVAVDDGTLYAVGQTRSRNSSYTGDAEMLIVTTRLHGD